MFCVCIFSIWFVVLVYVCVCVHMCIYVCLCMLGFVCFVCLFGFLGGREKL